jgi:kynurenine formamidase
VEGAPLDAPLVTRGVLLDPARAAGRPWLRDDAALDAAQLDDCAERQGAWIEPGDAVLVRTGFLAGCRTARSTETWRSGPAPGLAPSCARWLRDRGVVLVGIDSPRLESRGPANPPSRLRAELLEGGQVHMAIGLDLEALGRACGADGDWSFLFVCPAPRRAAREATSGAVIHPLAIR